MNGLYCNEFDSTAAAWLRQLMADGLIPTGEVDERSIADVPAEHLRGIGRAHFFAGVGGWELALQLAGWPADRPVWTGSCPCQPYSSAGKQQGDADARNLWPEFFRLIRECRPECVFGEQVEGAIRHGWLDRVCADLEGEGYTVGAVVLGAHSAGAPHIRQRLYWVACQLGNSDGARSQPWIATAQVDGHGRAAFTNGSVGHPARQPPRDATAADAPKPAERRTTELGVPSRAVGVAQGNTDSSGPQASERQELPGTRRREEGRAVGEPSRPFWADFDLLPCRDGKARRVEPGAFPLAHGVSGRVGLLRGYGNAIVPQVAAAFIRAFLDAETERRAA